MSGPVLEVWSFRAGESCSALVLPDGCRDLILRHLPGGRPHWFVSDLSRQPYDVAVEAGTVMRGFRLLPGTQLSSEAGLLADLQGRDDDDAQILARLANHARQDHRVAEVLECLAETSVAQAARRLGVTPRTLQRLLRTATGQDPVAWVQLARVRRAGRAVAAHDAPLAELAADHGYADQAHMTRAFRRWLGITPAGLRRDPDRAALLAASGYG